MDWKIELIHVPVSDVDRAIEFYVDKVGFNEDLDVQPTEGIWLNLNYMLMNGRPSGGGSIDVRAC